jgi:hypothetical protein
MAWGQSRPIKLTDQGQHEWQSKIRFLITVCTSGWDRPKRTSTWTALGIGGAAGQHETGNRAWRRHDITIVERAWLFTSLTISVSLVFDRMRETEKMTIEIFIRIWNLINVCNTTCLPFNVFRYCYLKWVCTQLKTYFRKVGTPSHHALQSSYYIK